MNVVSSILYFIGEKIQRSNGIEEIQFAPTSGQISIPTAKYNADTPSKPVIAEDTIALPPNGTSLVGVSNTGSFTGVTLPLSAENGGTGKTTIDNVEHSTVTVDNNTWRVEKWDSGFVRASCITASKNIAINTSAGAGYYASETINLPEKLFKSITFADANRCLGTATTNIIFGSVRSSTKDGEFYKSLNTWLWTAQSVSGVNISIGIQVEGTWK